MTNQFVVICFLRLYLHCANTMPQSAVTPHVWVFTCPGVSPPSRLLCHTSSACASTVDACHLHQIIHDACPLMLTCTMLTCIVPFFMLSCSMLAYTMVTYRPEHTATSRQSHCCLLRGQVWKCALAGEPVSLASHRQQCQCQCHCKHFGVPVLLCPHICSPVQAFPALLCPCLTVFTTSTAICARL